MDLDGDGFLDLATINDGEIVSADKSWSRREHLFRNEDGERFRDITSEWLPDAANIGEDDNNVAFLDFDSDGDADFIIASLTGPDRLLINDGTGAMSLRAGVFDGEDTPGTLSLVLADLDGDHRLDVVQGQGENPEATAERIFLGSGLEADTAAPVIAMVQAKVTETGSVSVRARIHDRKSPSMPHDLQTPTVSFRGSQSHGFRGMYWVGEHLWRSDLEPQQGLEMHICVRDTADNETCSPSFVPED